MSMSSTSSTSGRQSFSGRNPAVRAESNLGKIEESVTNLLRATKELLETLTRWSRGQATEQDVSDVYVKLGSHFNIACRAFTAIGVETADLGNVPEILRTVLESTLSQPEASPQSLEVYLPRIREIIIDLLQGLKRKQKKLAARPPREIPPSRSHDIPPGGEYPPAATREPSMRKTRIEEQSYSEVDRTAPPRSSSLPQGPLPASVPYQMPSEHDFINPGGVADLSEEPYAPSRARANGADPNRGRQEEWPQPPPAPKQDALAALAARGDALERRASRRYSAYQIAKMTGTSPGAVPMLPSTPSAVPRVRESRESIDAMRNRGGMGMQDGMPKTRASFARREVPPRRQELVEAPQQHRLSDQPAASPDTPTTNTPVELAGSPGIPPPSNPSVIIEPETPKLPVPQPPEPPAPKIELSPVDSPPPSQLIAEPPPPPVVIQVEEPKDTTADRPDSSGTNVTNKELTLFLQLGRSVKKTVIQEGIEDLSMNTLRLLFISKFSYNPPSGDDFPEIYLQDTISGVRYELEDLHDIKDRSVLCLNIEVLDEVKRHIDDGLSNIKGMIEGLNKTIEGQGKSIRDVAAKQDESTKKITELSKRASMTQPSTPTTSSAAQALKGRAFGPISAAALSKLRKGDHGSEMKDIKAVQKSIAILRQTYDSLNSEMKAEMHTIRQKAEGLKSIQKHASATYTASAERMTLKVGKDAFSNDSDNLVSKVDDLQDTIEELRKDVVSRGVRPLPRQLEQVSRDIATARVELKKMGDYLKREKPVWKKIWERELEVVCEDQQFFNLQDELYADLQDDLDKASQTFALVEECTQQQLKAPTGSVRSTSRGFVPQFDESLDPSRAKDNVLAEVRALQPNHKDRLEAIERAEKARQQDLAGRTSPFKQELGQFVEESKLKKSGGFMEAERMRRQKDELHRKNYFKKAEGEGDTRSNASDETITTENLLSSISEEQASSSATAADAAGEPMTNGGGGA
ncbi:hypothetical protein ABW19_dt0208248 [Dactylella cylindrospora]|nr:hypothetical protein ABW19_dt0208248 [Dactylella cylindrospora]